MIIFISVFFCIFLWRVYLLVVCCCYCGREESVGHSFCIYYSLSSLCFYFVFFRFSFTVLLLLFAFNFYIYIIFVLLLLFVLSTLTRRHEMCDDCLNKNCKLNISFRYFFSFTLCTAEHSTNSQPTTRGQTVINFYVFFSSPHTASSSLFLYFVFSLGFQIKCIFYIISRCRYCSLCTSTICSTTLTKTSPL